TKKSETRITKAFKIILNFFFGNLIIKTIEVIIAARAVKKERAKININGYVVLDEVRMKCKIE
ncbi:MAG: hypothetical protein K6E69_02690, partial [Treponema sp.]|uniref:hypothetical protein n=1 Tax=Treponema sp. TaxID=166 RepID=UPI00298DCDC3